MTHARVLPLLACLLSLLVGSAARAAPAEAFLGLAVRDIPDVGCVVTWIDPGPLGGSGLESPTLARPDLLVSIDGVAATAASLREVLAAKAPGDQVTLVIRRANHRGPTLPARLDHVDAPETLRVQLADAALWRGTTGRPRLPAQDRPTPAPALLRHPAVAAALAAGSESATALDALVAAQKAMSAAEPDARRLSRVTAALTEPLALPELAEAIVAPTTAGLRPARLAATLVADDLDATAPTGEGQGSVPVPGVQGAIYALDFLAAEARLKMIDALGDAYGNVDVARAALATADGMRASLLIQGPDASARFATIQRGAAIDMDGIVAALNHLDAELAIDPEVVHGEVEGLPDELKGAVEGVVLSAQPIPDVGWAVVGGAGPNRYDLSKVAAVIDLDGDDSYWMSDLALGVRIVVDVSGNDRYEGNDHQGIAGGVCGLFLVDDLAGNDVYRGKGFHAGSGCFGAGLLIDRGGNDRYEGTTWSLGAACWGAGVLVDLGGSDVYRSEFLSEGCGGPRGLGAIVDRGGDDLYVVDGVPSQYETPATSSSFSQGVGVGIRRAAAGGIGLLSDLGGDDRYVGGEFSQGGGYYFALGVLHDAGGNDRYVGDRYGQAWAAHQASGILIDGGGDDSYVARTAANQGAAWDQSTALLWDKAGSDSYRGDGLSQGSAAQQAIAFLVDGGGIDHYVAAGDIAQGHSGTNEYHFGQAAPIGGIHSFSLLLDLPGAGESPDERDHFSTGRARGVPIRPGTVDAANPANSTIHGLFLDVDP